MVFSEGENEPTPPEPRSPSDKPHGGPGDSRRAKLTVVK
jgi:hypothetical protein